MLPQALIAILLGLAGLVWSADRFVAGAAATARNFGMSPLLIGLTIVALGTSAPEIFVAVNAALSNSSALAVGNAIGSNIANIGLVLGATLLIAPIPIMRSLLLRESFLLIIATIIGAYCLWDYKLDILDGSILLITLIVIFSILIISKSHEPEPLAEIDNIPSIPLSKSLFWLIISIVLLIISAQALVWGGKTVATYFGVSELIIGLTIVAIGTSLPELAASVASALKGHHDIAIGNILGSNLLNILAVMAAPALITPAVLEADVLIRDYAVMSAITALLIVLMAIALFLKKGAKKAQLLRWEGSILIFVYIAYTLLMVL